MLDGAALNQIFRPGSAMTISQTSVLQFTPNRQWIKQAVYILNNNPRSWTAFLRVDLIKQEFLLSWAKFERA